MSVIAGKDGSIKVGAAAVGYIDNWSLTINAGTAETSQLGEDFKEFVGTVKDWSGSMSGSLDPADAQQKSMLTAMGSTGTTTAVSVSLAAGSGTTFAGDALLTSIQIGAAHGDKITFSANFQGTGALTVTVPTT